MSDVTPLSTEQFLPVAKYSGNGTDFVLLATASNLAALAYGTTVPTDGDSGYVVGCLYLHTDGGDGTALYVNEGSSTSCNFNAITVA